MFHSHETGRCTRSVRQCSDNGSPHVHADTVFGLPIDCALEYRQLSNCKYIQHRWQRGFVPAIPIVNVRDIYARLPRLIIGYDAQPEPGVFFDDKGAQRPVGIIHRDDFGMSRAGLLRQFCRNLFFLNVKKDRQISGYRFSPALIDKPTFGHLLNLNVSTVLRKLFRPRPIRHCKLVKALKQWYLHHHQKDVFAGGCDPLTLPFLIFGRSEIKDHKIACLKLPTV